MIKNHLLTNTKNQIWLNVASSTFVMDEYVNLDNHIFLRYLRFFKVFSFLLKKGHKDYVKDFISAKKMSKLIIHDCRKKLDFPDVSVDHIVCSHFLEHIFPNEMELVVKDFYRCLKSGGTLHIVVSDINEYIEEYLKNRQDPENYIIAADKFISSTLLTRNHRGNFRFRLLEFLGGSGLNHRWMYDNSSMEHKIKGLGYKIIDGSNTPSYSFRKGDGSVHIFAVK